MISYPSASRAFAFARTEKAVSVPRRSIRLASFTPSSARSTPGTPRITPHRSTEARSVRYGHVSDPGLVPARISVAYILRRCYRYVTAGVYKGHRALHRQMEDRNDKGLYPGGSWQSPLDDVVR